jgi:hypothetical protein
MAPSSLKGEFPMPLSFKINQGNGDFKSVPSGSHIAICNIVVDLGLQPGTQMFPAPKHQVFIRFEVPQERVEWTDKDGKKQEGPIVIGQTFTASMHEKANLRKQLEGWRGRKFTDEEAENFDVSSILGKACMLSVVENVKGDKVYSNIASIGALPKGFPAPVAENKLLYYAEDNKESYAALPEWIRKKIDSQIRPDKPQPDYGDQSVAWEYEDRKYNPTKPDIDDILNEEPPF